MYADRHARPDTRLIIMYNNTHQAPPVNTGAVYPIVKGWVPFSLFSHLNVRQEQNLVSSVSIALLACCGAVTGITEGEDKTNNRKGT